MSPETFDPTAGERARAIRQRREDPLAVVTDPTAGERARAIKAGTADLTVLDPTDPRYGLRPNPEGDLPAA
jgi:hypothetical protein